jgi:hypothetical protein
MQEISKSTSYVQNRALLRAETEKQETLQSICERAPSTRQVWDLLQTPQTVETLSRRLEDEDVGDITASLTQLIREELIQISPDS